MSELNLVHIEESMADYDLFLFDLWGVIIEIGDAYPGIFATINDIIKKKEVIFLTNAPRPNYIVANNLKNMGITEVTPEMVITSGDVARHIMLNYKKSHHQELPKIYHLGDDRNDDILRDIKHIGTKNIQEADILVLTAYRDEHEDIHEFDEFLKKVAKIPNLLILCANPDKIIPRQDVLRYGPGHFASIIEQQGGKVIYTGKPEKSIYDLVFQRKSEIARKRILMIGDTFETDILGANRSGIHSALVLTGNSQPIHKMHESLSDKLIALSAHSKNIGITPTFVTKITK